MVLVGSTAAAPRIAPCRDIFEVGLPRFGQAAGPIFGAPPSFAWSWAWFSPSWSSAAGACAARSQEPRRPTIGVGPLRAASPLDPSSQQKTPRSSSGVTALLAYSSLTAPHGASQAAMAPTGPSRSRRRPGNQTRPSALKTPRSLLLRES